MNLPRTNHRKESDFLLEPFGGGRGRRGKYFLVGHNPSVITRASVVRSRKGTQAEARLD